MLLRLLLLLDLESSNRSSHQRAIVEPTGIQRLHPRDQLPRIRDLTALHQPIKVLNIALRVPQMPGPVELVGELVPSDDDGRAERLDRLDGADPLAPQRGGIGLGQHLVHGAVDDVARDGKLQILAPQHRAAVRVGVPDLDGSHRERLVRHAVPQFELPGCRECLGQYEVRVDLVRELAAPRARKGLWFRLAAHVGDDVGRGHGARVGEPLLQRVDPEPVVAVAVCDVDVVERRRGRRELALNPVGELGVLLLRDGRVDQHGRRRRLDQRARYR